MSSVVKCCLVVFSVVSVSVSAWADKDYSADTISYRYKIISEEVAVGSFEERRKQISPDKLQLIRTTRIDVSMSLWKLNFVSNDSLLFKKTSSSDYRLYEVDRRITEDGKTYRVEGEYRAQDFFLNAGFVADLAKDEQDSMTDGVLAVAAAAVPYWGTVLSVFADDEKGGMLMLSNKDYDATVEDIPYLIEKLTEKPRSFRLLDTQELEVNEYTLSLGADENCSENGVVSLCQKLQVRVDDYRHSYWVGTDRFGPYLLKAEGVDQDGPYRIELETVI